MTPKAMEAAKKLVIVPAYNEASNIKETLRELREKAPDFDVVVIDDGSSDDTARCAESMGVPVLKLAYNLGIGGAVQTGYLYALDRGYDCAVQVDADGQHDPANLSILSEPIIQSKADLVIGSRFIRHQGFQSTPLRKLGINFLCSILSRLTGLEITDPTSGFRAAGRRALEILSQSYLQDYPEPESIIHLYKFGLKIREIPVRMRPRQLGTSSIHFAHGPYYILKVALAILTTAIFVSARHRK